jgi:HAD superfamily hydrolase (TIGR01509 family)
VGAPDLVVFDCDGVLVDSEGISNAVLVQMLAREGLELTVAESRERHQGKLLGEIVAVVEAELGRPLPPDWPPEYERERDAAFRERLQPVPGARAAVEAVRRTGAAICVASQGRVAKTELTLTLTGLRDLFPDGTLFSAEQVPRGKPHPDLFLHAARSMGADPARCAVVEDSASGVQAARAAGMRVLGYTADSDARALSGDARARLHGRQRRAGAQRRGGRADRFARRGPGGARAHTPGRVSCSSSSTNDS